MDIVRDGVLKASIVLPEDCTPREKFAAEELASYIEQMCGLSIQIGGAAENLIVIGDPSRNKYAEKLISGKEFKKRVPGPEGFIIKARDDMLLLAGSHGNDGENERGMVYAVYELLERYLGCSLAAYGNSEKMMGEYVPQTGNITMDDTEYISAKCDVEYRCAIIQYSNWLGNPNHALNKQFISWLAKNRYNRIMTWASVYEGFKSNGMLQEAEKRGIVFSVGHHESTKLFLPPEGNSYFPEKYYETHPEFYKLTKESKRYFMEADDYDGQLILCLRNRECINEIAKNILKWTDENPSVDVISLWPNDGTFEQCCCEKCSQHSKSENYTYFVNEVAKIVRKEKPNIKIDRIVYCDLLDCGEEELSESIIIDESVWHSSGLRHIGKTDGSGLRDTVYEQNILKWREKGAKVVYYDYFMGIYAGKQKLIPMADEMQSVCKRFVEKDIYGLGTQIEVFNLWNNIFNFYTYGRTAYNTALTMEDNLESFSSIFGGGAEYIKEIIREYEKTLDGQVTIKEAGEFLINNIDKNKIYSLFDNALDNAATALSRNNIRMMRMAFRYSDLEVNSPHMLKEIDNITTACDETGELWYMSENFDSFISGRQGYAIALPVQKTNTSFTPDRWYSFENN